MILLVMTDGRWECLEKTIASFDRMVTGNLDYKIIHDDSQSEVYRGRLKSAFPDFQILSPQKKCGFGGSIQSAWSHLRTLDSEYVFHLEDDFTFNEEIDLSALQHVLVHHHNLVQVALRRQAWNSEEVAAGGIIERNPQAYTDCSDGLFDWLEHREFFTTNPSVYRRELCYRGWPSGSHSEGMFTHELLTDPDLRFAFWGNRDSAPLVHHIGDFRTGEGY